MKYKTDQGACTKEVDVSQPEAEGQIPLKIDILKVTFDKWQHGELVPREETIEIS
jgi:hypothetical protein